jgi:hypothetical protein
LRLGCAAFDEVAEGVVLTAKVIQCGQVL